MKGGTVVFEKVKTMEYLMEFCCLWEIVRTIEFSYNKGSK